MLRKEFGSVFVYHNASSVWSEVWVVSFEKHSDPMMSMVYCSTGSIALTQLPGQTLPNCIGFLTNIEAIILKQWNNRLGLTKSTCK